MRLAAKPAMVLPVSAFLQPAKAVHVVLARLSRKPSYQISNSTRPGTRCLHQLRNRGGFPGIESGAAE